MSRNAMYIRATLIFAIILVLTYSHGCQVEHSQGSEAQSVEVECQVNLGLNEESGIKTDWCDTQRSWSYMSNGDQITLTRKGSCGDECNFTEEIILSDISDSCPSFLSARYILSEAGSPVGMVIDTTMADEGILKIEKWEYPNGIISGKLETEVKFTFYLELQEN